MSFKLTSADIYAQIMHVKCIYLFNFMIVQLYDSLDAS